MSTTKTPCPYQGPGKQDPADVGGYDMMMAGASSSIFRIGSGYPKGHLTDAPQP
ncbi:hypothetical protein [Extibacter muris]|uniref:hypothetical protein n=1 Tax=Extibacter muris TaxID=1796622 RepID=UPI00142E0433|nr:hypothetical protein [Extibacter muris]MCU0080679.1 hypothetical protein [Extibacter muris]